MAAMIVVAGLGLSLTAGAAWASTGTSGPVQSTDPTKESYVDPFDINVPVSAIVTGAQSAFGGRYGGAWIDRSGSPVLRVGIVSANASDAQTLAAIADNNPAVVAQSVYASADQWQSAENVAESALQQDGVTVFGIEPNITDQSFTVETRSLSTTARAAIDAAVPPGVRVSYVVDPNFTGGVAMNGCRSCYPPYEAGLTLSLSGSGGAETCTTGLALENTTNGQKFGTTAGHCGIPGWTLYVGGNQLQNLGTDSLYGHTTANADVARYQVSDQNITHRIYTGPGTDRLVTGKFPNSELLPGTRVCFQGTSSNGDNCGTINANGDHMYTYFTTLYGYVTVNHSWCIDYPVLNGDSGGPVYHVKSDGTARAAGSVTYGNSNNNMCFSGIEGMENEMNATLIQS